MIEDLTMSDLLGRDPKPIFWGNLNSWEADELMFLFRLYRGWENSWDCVRRSHEKYNIPYSGPTAFMTDWILNRIWELTGKGWGIEAYKKSIREETGKTAKESEGIL